jgi:hypothetical protein
MPLPGQELLALVVFDQRRLVAVQKLLDILLQVNQRGNDVLRGLMRW